MQCSKCMCGEQIRKIHLYSRLLNKNHYDALGITRRATQSEIKGAYYKLSMLYHPDKNKSGEDAAQKFRSINAAYEVLGNVKLRKLYDKGMLRHDLETISEDDAQTKFYKAHANREKPPTPSGRTPIYNFDEWSKNHYAYTFNKKLKSRQRQENLRQYNERRSIANKSEHLIIGLAFLSSMLFMMSLSISKDYDSVIELSNSVPESINSCDED